MDYEFSDLNTQAKDWAKQVINSAWATDLQLTALLEYDARSPETLFNNPTSRPLIVAFLGGTGVGKSTLLNRLAAKEIARTGEVRPTSKEVTLFHHESVKIAHLPSRLPLDKIKISTHSEAKNQHIIWIDMPDFDSTEHDNQQMVLEWLPHIDVLIYVVSPERYRDNKAWQILLAEGGKHAWIFVINQSDRGHAAQYQDFIKQLNKAGFTNPLVYQCCAINKSGEHIDEFATLQTSLQTLATENTVQQLELRGLQLRHAELSQILQSSISILGPDTALQDLTIFWKSEWRDLERLLSEASILPIKQMAEYYASHSGELKSKKPDSSLHHRLWDKWSQTRFDDALDALILQADQIHLPVMPLKNELLPLRESCEKIIEEQSLLSVRKALIKPGNFLQRLVISVAKFAEIVLPISSMAWVGYQVFIEFYESSVEEIPHYVGTDFLINGTMLIAISWLFPYFLQKKLKPSIEKAAEKGLTRGYMNALQLIELQVLDEIKNTAVEQETFRQQIEVIIEKCKQEHEQVVELPANSTLERMLL